MAEGKKSFVLYTDLIHTFKYLSLEQKGMVITWVLEYVNDMNPEPLEGLLQAVVEPIKLQLKRDLKKYETKKKQWSEAGKRSAESRKVKKKQRTLTTVDSVATDLTVNVNVNDTVNDTVSTYVDKKEIEVEVDDPQVISISYEEIDFLKNWNEARIYFLDTPSNLNKLRSDESDLFWSAKNEFTKDDFHKAMKGLFKQERVPSDIMVFRPKHFLGNIETYLDAENNKRYKLYA